MVFFLGIFLINALCAIVPCQKVYDPPIPVPKFNINKTSTTQRMVKVKKHSLTKFTIPIMNVQASNKRVDDLVVKIDTGLVQGFRMKTIRARDIFAFTGIPYAEPPTDELRYRAPVKKMPWNGIFQANQMSNDCMQIDGMQLLRVTGSENCLAVNVYTPIIEKQARGAGLPVMIFIHGGSFAFSSGSKFGPAYLLDRDVILVTFNYRLNSFGFLATGDKAAPGNFGLKDQVLLLRWVQSNIFAFGGDPKQITLFGQSAGAVMVHLHILSKQSQGLFQSGISQSGNGFCFWGVRDNSIDYTFRLANALKCPINDSMAMVDCLRKLDPVLISYTEANLPSYKVFPGVFFGPIIEPKSDDAFLDERPEVLYAQNRVQPIPWINGFLANEGNGIGFLAWLYPLVVQEMDEKWVELGPSILDLQGDVKHLSRVSTYIRNYYFGDEPIGFDSRKRLTHMMGDRLIMGAIHKGLKYHSKVANTYGYYFDYSGRYGTAAQYGLRNVDWGISHDDDLIYLMNSTSYQALKVGEPEYEMSEFLTNVWAGFALHGEPTFDNDEGKEIQFWDPISSSSGNDIQIVHINGDMPKMIQFPFLERVKLWGALGLISKSKVGSMTMKKEAASTTTTKPLSNALNISHIINPIHAEMAQNHFKMLLSRIKFPKIDPRADIHLIHPRHL